MRQGWLVLVLAVCGWMVLPGAALGATVSVTETPGTPNQGLVDFRADSAEANRLTVTVAGESGEFYDLQLVDSGAAIKPGPGCAGGGVAGDPVHCQVHKPVAPTFSGCTKSPGCASIPGTGWTLALRFVLGNGGSQLNAGSLPDPLPLDPQSPFKPAITVLPGNGNDVVVTAAGNDLVESSPGSDRISTQGGVDTIRAGRAADGADVVDLGLGLGGNRADYGERTETVIYKDNDLADDGGLGEEDKLIGVTEFQAGAGDDLLGGLGVPDPRAVDETLLGGPGTDLILGGPGNDIVAGEAGDDRVFGQDGDDLVVEATFGDASLLSGNDILDGGAGNDSLRGSYGDDRASGGDGDDSILLGPGADQAEAGAGADLVRGESENDFVRGGSGDDRLVGDAGGDTLLGDAGGDQLLVGVIADNHLWERLFLYSGGPIENVRDSVDCGVGSGDRAGVDGTDVAKSCEKRLRLSRLELLPLRFPLKGSTQLLYEARVPGAVSISGPGVRPARHHDGAQGTELGARFLVKPAGKAAKTLRLHGRVRVRVTVTLRPDSGGKIVRRSWVRIRRSP